MIEFNGIIVCVELSHPDISGTYNEYITYESEPKKIIELFKRNYKNSYYHNIKITLKAVIGNEIYTNIIYDGDIL